MLLMQATGTALCHVTTAMDRELWPQRCVAWGELFEVMTTLCLW